MKTLMFVLSLCVVSVGANAKGGGGHSNGHSGSHTSGSHSGDHTVSGYVKKDGTYVAPAHATNPNSTKLDNYSTKGNVNPYTGKEGPIDPYAPSK